MNLPQNLSELKNVRQWVNYIRIWNATKNGGRGGYDKPPINPETLRDAMPNNPATWTTYERAAANIGRIATHKDTKHKDPQGRFLTVEAPIEGTGLILAAGYVGVDLDNVIDEEGRLAPFAAAILDRLDTYTEISPSGRGLHLYLYCGDLLEAAKAAEMKVFKEAIAAGLEKEEVINRAKGAGDFGKQFILDAAGAITDEAGKVYELEIYFYVRGRRYFTVTGNVYRDRPINRTKGAEILALRDEYTAKADAYRAAKRPVSTVGTSYTIRKAATGDQDRKMTESALRAIDPGALDFGGWFCIVGAIKYSKFLTYNDFEKWTAGDLCGSPNSRNIPENNAGLWNRAKLKDTNNTERLIISTAKRFNWTPAEAFDDEARAEYGRSLYSDEERAAYGRSLHTEEERREYGRKLHEERLEKWWNEHADGFRAWKERHKNPQTAAQPQQPAQRSEPKEISLDGFKNWENSRKKG